jgi:phosphatidylglycerophosphate synthase
MKYDFWTDFKLGWKPNLVTASGLLSIPTIIYAHIHAILWLIPFFFAFAWYTDWKDGNLARKLNLSSQIGAFFDPLADKIFTWSLLIYCWDRIPMWISIPIIAFGAMNTGVRIYKIVEGKTKDLPYNIMAFMSGKLKTNFEKSGLVALFLMDATILYGAPTWLADVFLVLHYIGLIGCLPMAAISFWRQVEEIS